MFPLLSSRACTEKGCQGDPGEVRVARAQKSEGDSVIERVCHQPSILRYVKSLPDERTRRRRRRCCLSSSAAARCARQQRMVNSPEKFATEDGILAAVLSMIAGYGHVQQEAGLLRNRALHAAMKT